MKFLRPSPLSFIDEHEYHRLFMRDREIQRVIQLLNTLLEFGSPDTFAEQEFETASRLVLTLNGHPDPSEPDAYVPS